MNSNSKYDVAALLDMAQEYLTAENEYRVFLLTWKGGWVPSMDPEKYGQYIQRETEARSTSYALRSACRVVSADYETVISMAKAMNRFEKRNHWQVCAHIGYRAEDNARRFLAVPDAWEGHFRSTGRRFPWVA